MPDVSLAFRRARAEDVPDIVRMLADDPLGATRERYEHPLPESYRGPFAPSTRTQQRAVVTLPAAERVVGVLQLTYLHVAHYQGGCAR